MASDGTFKDIKDGICSALVDTTRTAGQIASEDLAFHRSSNPSIVPLLEEQSSRLLRLTKILTRVASLETDVTPPQISDLESVEHNWKGVVDIFDNLLEKADACLDEYTGVIKRLSPSQEEKIKKAATLVPGKQKPAKAYRTQNIPKPQLLFDKVPTNDDKSHFKPLFRHKPHAIIPFQESLSFTSTEDDYKQYKHPYETEIKESQYPAATYIQADPIRFLPYESTKATLVDTPEAVATMLEELKGAKEIAVDLEHHDEHSYVGLVSLMQISTRDKDWIVDTLKPWRQDLQILNEVFADPNILKVFHGATMDMIWLQRDFGLYVVGLFDTYHASRSLGYPRHSLAYLLKRFVDFDAAKQYQMADWRIRPLPEEMFNYARSDTHFLLYIYDSMRNELVDRSGIFQPHANLIEAVMQDSKEESLQRYERPLYDIHRGSGPMGWYHMLFRTPALFDREQFSIFRAVHQWRDSVARQEDESVHVVMPKNALYNISREMPADMPSLLGCSHPISEVLQKRKGDLLRVIKQAKVVGGTGPDMSEMMKAIEPVVSDPLAKEPGFRKPYAAPTTAALSTVPTATRFRNASLPRAKNSHFWASILESNTRSPGQPAAPAPRETFHLAIPLPQLNAGVFEDPKARGALAIKDDTGTRAQHPFVKKRSPSKDDIFIAKQQGGPLKRKAAATQASPKEDDELGNPPNEKGDEMAISVDVSQAEDQAEANRKAAKRQKKVEKKRMKQERLLQSENARNGQGAEEAEKFDYTNAPSMLHAKKRDGDQNGRGKPINPYTKSMNAPKGMRTTKKEIGGKSFTFKS